MKKKKAIDHALHNDLGYYCLDNKMWYEPLISLREMICALCDYLDVDIIKSVNTAEAIKRRSNEEV